MEQSSYATIPGFEQLSAQQVFEMSATHLLKQNARSEVASEGTGAYGCRYRGQDGLKCAAGVFLRDDAAKSCERSSWRSLAYLNMVPSVHVALISSLQAIHDSMPLESWYKCLSSLGKEYNLDTSFMDKL